MVLSASRSLRVLGGTAALVAGALLTRPAPAGAQVRCEEPSATRSGTDTAPHPAGIRYRFASGDFMTDPSGRRWIRFLTAPTITEVDPAGPAAGRLDPGDVIETVDGVLVTTLDGSRRLARVGARGSGTVPLGIRRAGRALHVRIPPCPGAPSDPEARPADAPDHPDAGAGRDDAPEVSDRGVTARGPASMTGGSGIRLRCLDCRYRDGRWSFSGPPLVTGLRSGGPAERAGLRAGDELIAVDGLRLGTPAGDALFSELGPGDAARWTVRRDGTLRELTWTVGG